MSNLFSIDNPVFTFLGKACDVIILSLVWIVLCIPIVTIGPSNTALYYATVKVIRRERGYLLREFFKSFRLNFKKGLIVGVFLTLCYIVLGFDLMWAWNYLKNGGAMGSILLGAFAAISILVACFSIYIYPILSRFEMSIKQLVKASIFMSLRHLPSTIAMLIITAAGFVLVYMIPILFFVIPGSVVILNSFLMEKIFKKYMPKAETEEENTKKDEWYLE